MCRLVTEQLKLYSGDCIPFFRLQACFVCKTFSLPFQASSFSLTANPRNLSLSDILFCMMGGYSFEEDSDFILPRTLVLVGKTGNGKSATGNSILGMQMFQSKRSSSAVTTTCELKTTVLEDSQTLNVIDTPGLFDSSIDSEFIKKEIVSCINMAKDGIDAFLVVISVRIRFSNDEKAVISRLLTLFGRKSYDYMILVFTGGDELEDDGESLEDFLHGSPKALQEILRMCGNRCVLFDNKTKDPTKRLNQVQRLLFLVNMVSMKNGGKPYTNELFTELKVELKLKETTLKLEELLAEERDSRLLTNKKILKVESKLEETTLKLEQLLTEERTARLKAEEHAKISQKKDGEIHKIESRLKEATLKLEQLLAEERTARLKTEGIAKAAQKKSDEEIEKVESKLKDTTRKFEQLLAEERTARLKLEEKAEAAQKSLEEEIQKKWTRELDEQEMVVSNEQYKLILEMSFLHDYYKAALKKSDEEIQKVETKLKEKTLKLEHQLAEERTARLKTKENAKAAQKTSDREIKKLTEKLLKEEQLKEQLKRNNPFGRSFAQ